MRKSLNHLLWGVVLVSLSIILTSMVSPLMRVCAPLASSQTNALICVSELLAFLPYAKLAIAKWSIKTKSEWLFFGLYGLILASNFAFGIYCSQNMPLGENKAIYLIASVVCGWAGEVTQVKDPYG